MEGFFSDYGHASELKRTGKKKEGESFDATVVGNPELLHRAVKDLNPGDWVAVEGCQDTVLLVQRYVQGDLDTETFLEMVVENPTPTTHRLVEQEMVLCGLEDVRCYSSEVPGEATICLTGRVPGKGAE